MAIGTKIAVANFWEVIPIQQTDGLRLVHQQELASQASGGTLSINLADPLWGGTFTSPPLAHVVANGFLGLLDAIQDQQATFYAYDLIGKYPKLDPTGSIIGSSTVQLNTSSVPSLISMKGLPVGYALSRGDLIQHTYSSTHTALYRVAEPAIADGLGVIGEFTIVPKIRQARAVNDAMSLKKPQMLAQLVPGSIDLQRTIDRTVIKFQVSQVLDA